MSWITNRHHFGHVQACLTTSTWNNQLIFFAFMDLYSHPKTQLHTSTCFWDILVYRILYLDWPRGFLTITWFDFSQTCVFFLSFFFLKKVKRPLTKTGIHHFTWWYLIKKNLMIQISCIADRWKDKQSQIIGHFR